MEAILNEIKSPAPTTLKQYHAGWQKEKEDGSYQLGWLERRKDELKESTCERSYSSIIKNHLLPQFGTKQIDEIEISKVYNFITDLKNRHKIQMARNIINCLTSKELDHSKPEITLRTYF